MNGTLSRFSRWSSRLPPASLSSLAPIENRRPSGALAGIRLMTNLQQRPALLTTQPFCRPTLLTSRPGYSGSSTSIRAFSLWRIPIMLMTAGKTKRRIALATTLGGMTLVSAVAGPVVWLVVGGIASILAWRVWRQTSVWWKVLAPPAMTVAGVASKAGNGIFDLLKAHVGTHRAADQVQKEAISQIMKWADTPMGRRVLTEEFNADHIKDLSFLPVHSSSFSSQTIKENNKTKFDVQRVEIQFFAEDDATPGDRGGGCIVRAVATIDGNGKIRMEDIRLSAPDWTSEERIPIESLPYGDAPHRRIIEGEFKDV
ncbi:hypothetical protein J3Q64DRAFT_1706561 [Phycomyces blakesleeanus]|uniref:Uncharacterized protein n=2 Tax=Phycomyces blakesleeanus TaxID=4837 RepID=A0A167PEF8_PHYB8|nr:hypothetical protein PHYBLDRAFT_164647 [Phycomyces blakesleeanus NRRL 1555(-)]OAD77757.1 hypothetical protein PHYBLDRAFT_164647 [Phycomyces blakesleeanus NRRL 1555(-)]|eukprot:XP_018295797.1 hypothetical protein PHYBLDRAFT_164647 [Phycomyces blakesleeanus NRRL 1555(-)]